MNGFKYLIAGIGVVELGGLAFAWAVCKAAAKRPTFGPPIDHNPNEEH